MERRLSAQAVLRRTGRHPAGASRVSAYQVELHRWRGGGEIVAPAPTVEPEPLAKVVKLRPSR